MTTSLLLKTLEHALEELQMIPLWGSPPAFPWETFSEILAKGLDQKQLLLSHRKSEWLTKETLLEGMGDSPTVQPFTLSPLPGPLFWVLPTNSRNTLVQHLLIKEENSKGLSDPLLQEGFYHYLCLNILNLFNRQNVYGNLTATLGETQELPPDGALCIDIAIQFASKPLWGRIICPRETHASFQAHFAMENPPLLSDPSFENLPLSLHLEVGSTTLSASEWKRTAIGDFLLLERCTYDLQNQRGTAVLSLGTTPLFDTRIKEGTVKILEHALIQEEKQMTKEHPPEDEFIPEDETFSDLEDNTQQDPLWSTNNGDEGLLPSKEIPITITVEVSRFQMPLNKVTQLKPGNVLDLALSPQPNVHLVAGGKRIAKGELVQLGEALGVKILNLGD